MSRKFLSKVVAGASLGAAALLICAPGTAMADDAPPKHDPKNGRIYTEPKGVKPGAKFKVILKCEHPVDRPWVWSKVTGKLWLKPWDDKHDYQDSENGAQPEDEAPEQPDGGMQPEREQPDGQPDGQQPGGAPEQPNGGVGGQDDYNKDDKGKHDKGKDDKGKHDYSKDDKSKHDYSKDDKGKHDKYWAWAKVPWETKAGHYKLKGACDSYGTVAVLPKGAVDGGDGGAGTDPGRTAAGAGMLGAAAVGGFLLMRRRRTDGSPT